MCMLEVCIWVCIHFCVVHCCLVCSPTDNDHSPSPMHTHVCTTFEFCICSLSCANLFAYVYDDMLFYPINLHSNRLCKCITRLYLFLHASLQSNIKVHMHAKPFRRCPLHTYSADQCCSTWLRSGWHVRKHTSIGIYCCQIHLSLQFVFDQPVFVCFGWQLCVSLALCMLSCWRVW